MAVTFDSAGAGSRVTGSATTISTTWTHTITTSNAQTCVVVLFNDSNSNAASGTVTTMTYGGVAMTLGNFFGGGTGNAQAVGAYYLFNPPTGAQTVSLALGGTNTKYSLMGISLAYQGVGSISTPAAVTGQTGATVTNAVGNYAIVYIGTGAALTSPTGGTSRYSNGASVTGTGDYFAVQDAPGVSGGSVTLSWTTTDTTDIFVGKVQLTAAASTPTNLFFSMF